MGTARVLTIVIALLGIVSSVSADLVGWWTFDEGAGATVLDSSANGNNGSSHGDPQWVDGVLGGALELDGDDYVDTGYDENLPYWTITCWVRSPAAPAPGKASGPVHRNLNYHFNWNHWFTESRGAVTTMVGSQWYSASLQPLEADTWYHIAGTYDGNALKAYRNGSLVSVNSEPLGPSHGDSHSLLFGRHTTEEDYYFTGTVDEVRVYDCALDAGEVAELAAVVPPDPEPGISLGLVAHYEFEGNADDSSGNGLHGTLADGASIGRDAERGNVVAVYGDVGGHVDCGNGAQFDMTDEITVSAWVNIIAVPYLWTGIVTKGNDAWRLSTFEDQNRFHFAVTGAFADPQYEWINGQIRVDSGQWHHVCGTYDGQALRLYVDGIEDADSPVAHTGPIHTSQDSVWISGRSDQPGRREFDGFIDDVRIYDHALTGAEVMGLVRIAGSDTLRIPIIDGNDDVEQHVDTGRMNLESVDLELVDEPGRGRNTPSGEQIVGLRFIDVPLNRGSILEAYVEFTVVEVGEGSGDPVNVVIEGLLVPNAAPFASDVNDITNRSPWTSAKVKWTVPEWTVVGERVRTTNIAPIIEEIISQPAWETDNALILIIRNDEDDPSTGVRIAESFEGSASGAPLLHIEQDSLVSHWTFDDGLGEIATDSAGESDGIVFGAEWTKGIIEGALWFDGIDDMVDCGADAVLAPDNLTVSAWVRPEQSSLPTTVLGKGSSIFDADYELLIVSNQVRFQFGNDDPSVMDFVSARSQGRLSPEEWHLITVTRDGSEATIFIDGYEDNSEPYSFSPAVRDTPLIIGAASYTGKIDDVRIYDRALSNRAIRELLTEAPSEQFLMAHWTMDEGTGNAAHDSAGMWDGILNGVGWTEGVMGAALLFQAQPHWVNLGTDPALVPEHLSITAWFQPTAVLGAYRGILTKGSEDVPEIDLALVSEGRIQFHFVSNDPESDGVLRLQTSRPVPLDEWTFAAATRDGTVATLYMNDEEIVAGSYDFPVEATANDPMALGHRDYRGGLDDVRIYNEALNTSQIRALFEAPFESEEPNLVSHWAFDAGSGEIALDAVGGFDGVISGATWTTGLLDAALHFDGDDDLVDCGSDATLAPANLTVSAWVKVEEIGFRKSIVHKGGSLFDADFDLLLSSGQMRFEFGNDIDFVSVRSSSVLTVNEWTLVACTRDGSLATILVNGVAENSQVYDFSAVARDLPLLIGMPKSTIDDVRIYDRALGEDEMVLLYEEATSQ